MRRMLRWHEVANLSQGRCGGHLKFTAGQVNQLSEQLVGHITLPQDPTYPAARTTFMNAFQSFPQIIVYCQGFADVVRSIAFAKEVGLKPVCRSGGHNTAGYSVNDDMVIDVSAMNYVRVDPDARIAWVGAGANFAQINATLELYGLHMPGGGCETVGAAGYMQGGGYGFTSLMFGMNCDQVLGVQMALADGRIVKANAKENPDLLWAVLGGTGNNFGVLLEIEYRLHELGELWGFGFKWPIENVQQAAAASEALHVWQVNFTGAAAPRNLGHESMLGYTQGSEKNSLAPYYLIRGMFNGSEAACRNVLEPLLKLMPNVEQYRDIWRPGTYRDLNVYLLTYPTELPPDVPASARSVAKSHIVGRQLTVEECAAIVELYRRTGNADNFIGFEPYGGAINAIAPDANAFWHRTASMDVFLFSFWLHENLFGAAQTYVSEFDRVVQPLSNGCSYQNYPNRQIEDFGNVYFGGNLPRLLQVKRAYDPDNLFTFPQGLGAAANAAVCS
jgi:FAD/FMN-containing dehydrogenase